MNKACNASLFVVAPMKKLIAPLVAIAIFTVFVSAAPTTAPILYSDGEETCSIQIPGNWQVMVEGGKIGIVLGCRRYKTKTDPDETLDIQERLVTFDIDESANDLVKHAIKDEKIKPTVEKCIIDGEEGRKIRQVCLNENNGKPYLNVMHIANHSGRNYCINWGYFSLKNPDAEKELEPIINSFHWTNNKKQN